MISFFCDVRSTYISCIKQKIMCELTALPTNWHQMSQTEKDIAIENRRIERYAEIAGRRSLKEWECKDLEVAKQRVEEWSKELSL